MSDDLLKIINELYKETYQHTLSELYQERCLFGSSKFSQPVILGIEHGVIFKEEDKFIDEVDEDWNEY